MYCPGEEELAHGVRHYIQECNRLGVIPASYFVRHIHDQKFIMKHHGLGPLGAKAIVKPLEVYVLKVAVHDCIL